ncbi:uncharacterized protein B0H18DRAFT_1156648 [Fomitopsis serialis]|uniref:uncharacterized protein n=1 Tax=Fomitopsis serialis TaxID=139415 RepID=UPI0020078E10|nr:uncharacterized protein B0H18DRAFT_1156648 [Neoantrodia serialis]KAH9928673.1 hypothetical protein B0H18DRAFT_1156648 [Neoantrodia serialis]
MSGEEYAAASPFQPEQHHQNPTSNNGGDDIPIDPALNAIPVDPALLEGGERENGEVVTPRVVAPQPKIAQFRQYSQAPQGDPFAPQPSPSYLPIEEPTPPLAAKPPKKKRQPKREEECGFCQGDDSRNGQGQAERMVSCTECGRSDIAETMHSYAWVCHSCKRCEICQKKEREVVFQNKMVLCERCDRGWHMDCLQPPLEEAPPGSWYCPLCEGALAQEAQFPPQPDVHYPTKVPPAANTPFAPYPAPLLEHPTKLPPEHIAAYRSSSVASSSRLTDGRGHDTAGATDESEADANGEATPAASRQKSKKKQRPKGKTPMHDDPDDEATPSTRSHKRPRVRLATPAQPSSPTQKSGTGLRIRLPFRDKGKAREDDSSDGPKGMFDDILSPEDRDMTEMTIIGLDKQRFEKSRVVVEERLNPKPPPAPLEAPETPGAGPSSRPLRSTRQATVTVPLSERSESPARSTPGPQAQKSSDGLRIRRIRFGDHDIDTWFDAPFPEEYANISDGRLWYCEFCLKYMRSKFLANRHLMKCKMRFPPGDEIYRDGPISIFENLCLLSKMFLDHKSLFYDVEPFLFYVIAEFDDVGARFVGYFSKEKRSPKDYNRRGWGQLLIDFSKIGYLLSRKEQRPGSPEKPLSPLGAISYRKYWTFALHRYFRTALPNPRLEDISAATAMTIEDICNTLVHLKMIRIDDPANRAKPMPGQAIKFPKGRKNGIARKHLQRRETHDDEKVKGPFIIPNKYEIRWNMEEVERYLASMEAKNYVTLKPEKLKWSPFIVSRTRKSEQLASANSETARAMGAQAMTVSDAVAAVVETATPGAVADSSAFPSVSPFDLFDDDVVVASSPSHEASTGRPGMNGASDAGVAPNSAPNDTLPIAAPEFASASAPALAPDPQPEEIQTDEQLQLEQDELLARQLTRDLQMSDRSLRRRGQPDPKSTEDARQRGRDESPSVRKSRPAAARRASVRVTGSVSPVKAGNSARRVSQDDHDETGKRPLRSRATTEPDVRAASSARSISPRKRRRIESPPPPEPEVARTPAPSRKNSRRGVTEDPAQSPALPRSQRKPTRRNTDTNARMASASPTKTRRSPRKPTSDSKMLDEPHGGEEDKGEPDVEMQDESANSPLTGVTSRHSVPSEDTVVVTPTAGGMNKASPGGVPPVLSTVDGSHAAEYDGADVMDVDEDEKDEDYTGNNDDQDAEGEPDNDGEPNLGEG